MAENDGTRIPIEWSDLVTKDSFACSPPSILYHYTDYEGANSILASKSLWLTKIQGVNDTSELQFAIDLFREIVEKRLAQFADEEKREFLKGASIQLESFRQTNICVGSFCEDGDLLSQWRAYGNSSNGVALGFQGPALGGLSNAGRMNLWKCIYSQAVQVRVVNDLVDLLANAFDIIFQAERSNRNWGGMQKDLVGYFNTTFLRVAPVLKNSHFKEEKEWRLVTAPMRSTDESYGVRIGNKRVSEYYSLDFSLLDSGRFEFIETVVVGPARELDEVGSAFGVLLRNLGYKHKSVTYSRIPYRVD